MVNKENGQRAGARRIVVTTALSALLSGGLLLAGCSEDRTVTPGGSRFEITVQASVAKSVGEHVSTKAPVDGTQELTLRFARSEQNEADLYGDYGPEFTGLRAGGAGNSTLVFSPKQYYSEAGKKTKIVGWYPQAESYEQNRASWTFDGTQDIMTALAQEGSNTSAMPVITFTHALTQLLFYCHADKGAAALWGNITAIELQGQQSACAYDLLTGAVTFSGPAADMSVPGFEPALVPEGASEAARQFGEAMMVQPQSAARQLQLTIHTEKGGELTVAVPAREYAAGKAAKITIRFTEPKVYVDPAVVITDWVDGGGAANEYPYVVDGKILVAKDLFGSVEPTHEPWLTTPVHSEKTWDANVSGYNTLGEKFEVASKDANDFNFIGWDAAVQACASYKESTDDVGTWRLPTERELKLIYDMRKQLTGTDLVDNYYHWSATEAGDGNANAWVVRFYNGQLTNTPKNSNYAVRCVRDLGVKNFEYPYVQSDGVTLVTRGSFGETDASKYPTHERWLTTTPAHSESAWDANASEFNTVAVKFEVASKDASGFSFINWDAAVQACASYKQSEDDAGTWRLPTERELKLIYDMRKQLTGTDLVDNYYHWSATEAGDGNANAWVVRFYNGQLTNTPKTSEYAVRCVRDVGVAPYVVKGTTVVVKAENGQADSRIYPTHEPWPVTPDHKETPLWNANESGLNTVAETFEVAASDAAGEYTVETAAMACALYSQQSDDEGTWRLPTIRELQLIYALRGELNNVNISRTYVYVSATAANDQVGMSRLLWGVYFPTGKINGASYNLHVRCVRDAGLEAAAYPYVKSGHTLVVADEAGQANAYLYPTHEPWVVTPDHSESGAWNANVSGYNTVAKEFRVAKENLGGADAQHSYVSPKACEAYSEESDLSDMGLWRIPTVRELNLIYRKRDALSVGFTASDYWSQTKGIASNLSWAQNFGNGQIAQQQMYLTYKAYIRCVRDAGNEAMRAYPYLKGLIFVLEDQYGKADADTYPTHEKWLSTPAHAEATWDANASGYNTLGKEFQIAKADAPDKDGVVQEMTWYEAVGEKHETYNPNAYSACAEYSEEPDQRDKGSWRVPTIREGKLIDEWKTKLSSVNLPHTAWLAAGDASNEQLYAWYVALSEQQAINVHPMGDKFIGIGYARCVRDLR